MKKIYESPEAEVISFAAMEQLASLKISLGDGKVSGQLGLSELDF